MPPEIPEVVAASAALTLSSTRAGGQDDDSCTNSPKLFAVELWRTVAMWRYLSETLT